MALGSLLSPTSEDGGVEQGASELMGDEEVGLRKMIKSIWPNIKSRSEKYKMTFYLLV